MTIKFIIEQYILVSIGRNDCVIIPGLGAFLSNKTNSIFNTLNTSVSASSRNTIFNDRINGENQDLINNIAFHANITVSKAKIELEDYVNKFKTDLRNNTTVFLGNYGKLSCDTNSLFKFELFNQFVYNYNTLGLSDISLEEINKPSDFKKSIFKPKFRISMSNNNDDFEQIPDNQFEDDSELNTDNEEIEDISEEELKPKKKKKIGAFYILSSIVILMLSASAIYLFTTPNGKESLSSFLPIFKNVSEEDTVSLDEKSNKLLPSEEELLESNNQEFSIEQDSKPIIIKERKSKAIKNAENSTVVLSGLVSSKTGRFYIIGGGFGNTSNAKILVDKASNSGLKAKVIAPYGGTKIYRVSLSDYKTQEEALQKAAELRADFGDEIWVLNY